jgi:outer membrane protein assembly factor BamB
VAVALEQGAVRFFDETGRLESVVALGTGVSSSPVISRDGTLVVPLSDGQIVGIKPSGIAFRVKAAENGRLGPIALGPTGEIYAPSNDGRVIALGADRASIWKVDLGAPIERSPVVDERDTLYVATRRALSAISSSGRVLWTYAADRPIVAGPLVANDGSLFVATTDGQATDVLTLAPNGKVRKKMPVGRRALPGLSLDHGALWIGFADWTLRRFLVPQAGLARSSWPKARGNLANTGAASAD